MKSFDVDINELPANKMRVLFSKNNHSQIICRTHGRKAWFQNYKSKIQIEF